MLIILIFLKDSEADEREETEEEFLSRYAKAAFALQSGSSIEEGEEMDGEDHEIELGRLLVRLNCNNPKL